MATEWEELPPMTNARAAVERVFPGARITSGFRGPNHPLSKKNPSSYHADTDWAVDVSPIQGIKYEQFLERIRSAGYDVVDHRDEAANPIKGLTTGPNWHVVLAGGEPAEPEWEEVEPASAAEQTETWQELPSLQSQVRQAYAQPRGEDTSELDVPEDPTWGEQFDAAREVAFADVPGRTDYERMAVYGSLIPQLQEAGYDATKYYHTMPAGGPTSDKFRLNFDLIFNDALEAGLVEGGTGETMPAEVKEGMGNMIYEGKSFEDIAAVYPEWSKAGSNAAIIQQWIDYKQGGGLGPVQFEETPRERFEREMLEEMKLRVAEGEAIGEDSDWMPWLAGMASGFIPDPVNALPIGGAGKTLGSAVVKNAAANVGIEALETPLIDYERQQQGRPEMTATEMFANLGAAAVLGGGLGALEHGVGKLAKPGTGEAPTPIGGPAPKKRTKASTRPTLPNIQKRVDEITSGWKAAPEIVVVRSAKDLPDEQGREVFDAGMEDSARGFLAKDGKIYVIAGNHKSVDDVHSTVFHEALGHAGLARVFNTDLDKVLNEIYQTNPNIRDAADAWLKKNDHYDFDDSPQARAVEEILAGKSEFGEIDAGTWQRIKSIIKEYARKMGMKLDVTDDEVRAILSRAHRSITKGKGTNVPTSNRMMNVGKNAKIGAVSKINLGRAKLADKRGMDRLELFKNFGWWKEADGEWRTRISDKDSGWKEGALETLPDVYDTDNIRVLGEVFNHPKLFKAYPELNGIRVASVKNTDYLGVHNEDKNLMALNLDLHKKLGYDPHSTILHEIQHAIQDREGFASGGNTHQALEETLKPREVLPAASKLLERYNEAGNQIVNEINTIGKTLQNEDVKELRTAFRTLAEAEAKGFSSDEYVAASRKYSEVYNRLTEKWGKEYMLNLVEHVLYRNPEQRINKLRTDLHKWDEKTENLEEALRSNDFETITEVLLTEEEVRREAYDWLLGEIEARETQYLMNLSSKSLKKHPPGSAEKKDPRYYRIKKDAATGNKYMVADKRPVGKGRERLEAKRAAQAKQAEKQRKKDRMAGNINTDHIEGSEDVKQFIRDTADEIKLDSQSQEETVLLARDLHMTPQDLIAGNLSFRPEDFVAARRVLLAVTQRAEKLAERIGDGDNGDQVLAEFAQAMALQRSVQEEVMGLTRRAGQVLQSFKIDVKARQAGALRLMAENGVNNMLTEEARLKNLAAMVVAHKNNPKALNKLARDVFDPKLEDYVLSYWYNNVLSGLETHTTNVVGTGVNFLWSLMEHGAAATLGQTKRIWNEEADRVLGREFVARLYGSALGFKQGIKNIPTAFATGVPTHAVSRVERNTLVMKGAAKALEVPVRTMASIDELFRNIIQLSDYYGMAVREAAKAGTNKSDFWDTVGDFVANPSEKMMEHSDEYARRLQLLDRPTWPVRQLERLKAHKASDGPGKRTLRFGARLLGAFARTMDSLIRTAIRTGPTALLSPTNWRMLRAGGADRDIAVSRILMGAAQGFWVISEFEKGNITGAGPTNPSEREKWLETHQEFSFKVGDKWVSYRGFEPFSLTVGMMATVLERMENNEDKDVEAFLSAVMYSANAVAENTGWMVNAKNFMDTVYPQYEGGNKVSAAGLAGGITSGMIPYSAAQRQINKAYIDPKVRDTTGDGGFVDRFKGRVMAGIPGLSDNLPVRHGVLGKERVNEGANAIVRTRIKSIPDDAVTAALVADNLMPSPVRRQDLKKHLDRTVTAEEIQAYQKLSGQYINDYVQQLIDSGEWEAMTLEERTKEMKGIVEDMRAAAREELFASEWEDV